MANPKITVTLTVDQSVMDAINAHTAALNRYCDAQSAKPVLDDKSAIEPAVPATPVVPETPSFAPTPMSMNTGAGAAHLYPAADATPGIVPPMPVSSPVAPPATVPVAPVLPIQAVATEAAQQAFTIPVAPATEITIEALMRAGVDLMNRGVNAAAVLAEFRVQTLTELPKDQYNAFAARLRQLGANI